jgi:hypothetical protein
LTPEENEIEDFEIGIIELANQCLAAMKRSGPSEPIIYEDEFNTKKSFEQKFGDLEQKVESDREPLEDDEPNYFRPNFNIP